MTNAFAYALLNRQAVSAGDASVQGRVSVDFVVDGVSLLQALAATDCGHTDFMGCVVRGFPEANAATANRLMLTSPPDTADGRTLLYICPECGDIACGAYAARVTRSADGYVWSDFAYINGYEPPRELSGVGPFKFSEAKYEEVVGAASVP